MMQEAPGGKLRKGSVPAARPNLYTSPGKKGTYGFIGTTLSERVKPGGCVGEYAYQIQPPQPASARQRPSFPAPFVPANPPKAGLRGAGFKTNIGNKAGGACGELQYLPTGALLTSRAPGHVSTAPKADVPPWVPPRAPRSGHNRTLHAFPKYYADPEHIKDEARRQAHAAKQAAMASAPAWHPAHVPRTGTTPSVMRMNI